MNGSIGRDIITFVRQYMDHDTALRTTNDWMVRQDLHTEQEDMLKAMDGVLEAYVHGIVNREINKLVQELNEQAAKGTAAA